MDQAQAKHKPAGQHAVATPIHGHRESRRMRRPQPARQPETSSTPASSAYAPLTSSTAPSAAVEAASCASAAAPAALPWATSSSPAATSSPARPPTSAAGASSATNASGGARAFIISACTAARTASSSAGEADWRQEALRANNQKKKAASGCWQQKEHSTGLWIERGEAGRWGCANVRYTLAARGKHTESCQGLRA